MESPIIDVHSHFFPDRMFAAIWKVFEAGRWPIVRKASADELSGVLRGHGVSHYTLLNYVRKPGQAESLNAWTMEFAASHPEALPFCTLHVEDPDPWSTVAPYLEEHGFHGIKVQPLVSCFGVDDPRLMPVLRRLADMGKILVVHTGTAPYANEWVGLARLERVLEELPELKVILPHMGAYEVEKAFEMLGRFPNLYLDTTMIFVNTTAFDTKPVMDPAWLRRFEDRILFGSDFPNIPYQYTESIESINRLSLPEARVRKIFYDNAARLFGIDRRGDQP